MKKIKNYISSHRRLLFFLFFILIIPIFIFADKTGGADKPPIKDSTVKVDTFNFIMSQMESMIGSVIMKIVSFFGIIVIVAGVIFDNLLAIGLSPEFFGNNWVYKPWASLRNIANAVFIVIFIWTAFQIMLNRGEW